jgi:hypothetical protein
MNRFMDIMIGIAGLMCWLGMNILVLVAIPIVGFVTLCRGLLTGDWCKEEWAQLNRIMTEGSKEVLEAIKYNFKG